MNEITEKAFSVKVQARLVGFPLWSAKKFSGINPFSPSVVQSSRLRNEPHPSNLPV
jgi:hypothetical protein